jgi:DNA-binding NarL/FixJ family response regulator
MTQVNNSENIKNTKIILVDDNIAFRTVLKKLLEIEYGCAIIAEVSNGIEFLELPCLCWADLVIMDLMMPKMDGFNATRKVSWHLPNLKIIAVTMHYDKTYLRNLIENGFKGCIFKSNLYDNLLEAITTVLRGDLYFPKELLHKK